MLLARAGETLADAVTDAAGRIAGLGGDLHAGSYTLIFELDHHFGSQPHLFERVSLEFSVAGGEGHQHVPFLISPFGVSSYRGA